MGCYMSNKTLDTYRHALRGGYSEHFSKLLVSWMNEDICRNHGPSYTPKHSITTLGKLKPQKDYLNIIACEDLESSKNRGRYSQVSCGRLSVAIVRSDFDPAPLHRPTCCASPINYRIRLQVQPTSKHPL